MKRHLLDLSTQIDTSSGVGVGSSSLIFDESPSKTCLKSASYSLTCFPYRARVRGEKPSGAMGKSALELLVALGMLCMLALLAVPNLMPLLRSSADRHHADALAFYIDDMRIQSAAHQSDISFYDVENMWASSDQRAPLQVRYPSFFRRVAKEQIKIVKPFAFHNGAFVSEAPFGRLLLIGDVSHRIVDVTATGELCVSHARLGEDLNTRAPCSSIKPVAIGCDATSSSGGITFPWFIFALGGIFYGRKSVRSGPRKSSARRLRGYVMVEAVAAALLLTLCMGLVYSYVGQRRAKSLAALKPNVETRSLSVSLSSSRSMAVLKAWLHSLPPRMVTGSFIDAQSPHLQFTASVEKRQAGLVLIRLVVRHEDDEYEASTKLWLPENRVIDDASRDASSDEKVATPKRGEP